MGSIESEFKKNREITKYFDIMYFALKEYFSRAKKHQINLIDKDKIMEIAEIVFNEIGFSSHEKKCLDTIEPHVQKYIDEKLHDDFMVTL